MPDLVRPERYLDGSVSELCQDPFGSLQTLPESKIVLCGISVDAKAAWESVEAWDATRPQRARVVSCSIPNRRRRTKSDALDYCF